MSETWCPKPEEIRSAIQRLKRQKHRRRCLALILSLSLALAAITAAGYCLLVSGVYTMQGDDMLPTLKNGEQVLSLRLHGELSRGEIVAASETDGEEAPLIRRVIGLGGDRVSIAPDTGVVSVNGTPLDEPYVHRLSIGNSSLGLDILVPKGYVFLLGDNRVSAKDSRLSTIGLIPLSSVEGLINK